MSDPSLDADAQDFAARVFDAARQGDADQLAGWLDQGLPVDLTNHRGDTLVMLASYHGHLEATRVLLAHDADVERHNDDGHSPLAGAAFKGHLAMLELLLEHGANAESRSPDGKTPLMFAAMFDRLDAVKALLIAGADAEAEDAKGNTALRLATTMGAQKTSAHLSGP